MASKREIATEVMSVEELSTLKEEEPEKKRKKHPALKFLLYFAIIIFATGIALFLSLYQDFEGVVTSLKRADIKYLLIILGLVATCYLIEGFIIFVFSRLYTRKYHYHQGLATSMVGAFYAAVTPGASGGQVMQIYTMKKQGVETSNAASIMIMSFIVYQLALIALGTVSLFFSAGDLIRTVGTFNLPIGNGRILHIPAIPLTIAGFSLNVIIILGLFLMSYSHKFHNLIMHYGIDILAKLRILKHPDKTRENLRIQVENFKIELRRLLSNIPIMILVFICFSLILIIKFSIPFFAGLALDGYGYCLNVDGTLLTKDLYDAAGNVIGIQPVMSTGSNDIGSFWQAVFLSSYHQMATGLIPLPGGAGVSEYFFNIIFQNYYSSQAIISAAQIIWRFSTFHIVLLVAGIVAATYRSSPKNEIHHANRRTFVTMQLETFEVRKASADTMFETASLSRKEIQARLRKKDKEARNDDINDFADEKPKKKSSPKPKPVVKAPKKTKQPEVVDEWDSIDAGED